MFSGDKKMKISTHLQQARRQALTVLSDRYLRQPQSSQRKLYARLRLL